MAVTDKPMGEISKSTESKGANTDVKTEEQSSEPQSRTEVQQQKEVQLETGEQLTEADLKDWQETKKVPYNRFKEVNEKTKTLQSELKTLQVERDSDIRRAVEDAEQRISQRIKVEREKAEFDEIDDPSDRAMKGLNSQLAALQTEIEGLRIQNSQSALQREIETLEKKYPEADRLAVLGWKKNQPNTGLEELMEFSHRRNSEKVENKIREILENKMKKSSMPTVGNSPLRLKPDERPKTLQEATRLFRKTFS